MEQNPRPAMSKPPGPRKTAAAARQERLAQALRANLRRRKDAPRPEAEAADGGSPQRDEESPDQE